MFRSKKCSTDKTRYSNLTQSVLTIRVGFQLTGRMRSPRWVTAPSERIHCALNCITSWATHMPEQTTNQESLSHCSLVSNRLRRLCPDQCAKDLPVRFEPRSWEYRKM